MELNTGNTEFNSRDVTEGGAAAMLTGPAEPAGHQVRRVNGPDGSDSASQTSREKLQSKDEIKCLCFCRRLRQLNSHFVTCF